MTTTSASQQQLGQVFLANFTVGNISEPLASFDATSPVVEVRTAMSRHAYKVAGVRRNGLICGYVRQEELIEGECGDVVRSFEDADVISHSAQLPELVKRFHERERLFVRVFGHMGGIVTKTDLQKPPVRMWLFGMITIIEMGLTRLIETAYPNDAWRRHLSKGRLEKATTLLDERKRRGQDVGLLDCLQLADRARIVLRDESLRDQAGFESRRLGEKRLKELEALRNNLAHSQDFIACDWEIIVRLTEYLERQLGSQV